MNVERRAPLEAGPWVPQTSSVQAGAKTSVPARQEGGLASKELCGPELTCRSTWLSVSRPKGVPDHAIRDIREGDGCDMPGDETLRLFSCVRRASARDHGRWRGWDRWTRKASAERRARRAAPRTVPRAEPFTSGCQGSQPFLSLSSTFPHRSLDDHSMRGKVILSATPTTYHLPT